MGRLGTFVPRLVALTAVWLLATTALTYAAAQRMNTPTATPAATTATTAAPRVLVVPDVRNQAYVFAKGSLGDSGFAWRVVGAVQGYPANTVISQAPAAGTRVIDTGAPLVVLRLQRSSGTQDGLPEVASTIAGTAVRLADLANAAARPATTPKTLPHVPAKVAAPAHRAPAKKSPPQQKRPPAFVVPGARREPLDEIPLTARARALLRWIDKQPKATDANVRYWLYQHAWIVTGAELGWWHGGAALQTLSAVDQRVWELWGIGAASKAQAEAALASVRAKEAK
jgi:hypothetical protein